MTSPAGSQPSPYPRPGSNTGTDGTSEAPGYGNGTPNKEGERGLGVSLKCALLLDQ